MYINMNSEDIIQPGCWELWKLDNDCIVLINMLKHDDFANKQPNVFNGHKIKQKLGFATNTYSAYALYNQYISGSVPVYIKNKGEIDEKSICSFVKAIEQ